jgi:hypothetical protein
MFPRGVAVCSVLALAAVAQGGVAVQLVPNPNLANYSQNQVVQVDVKLAQAPGGSDQLLRLVEFDLTTTHSFLTVALPTTHDLGTPGTGDDIQFWSFSSLSTCVTLPSFCGFSHFIDGKMAGGPVDTRDKTLSIAYRGMNADAQAQILLPANGTPVTVGRLQVTMPGSDGDYTLNLVNAAATGADQGARVDFGIDPHFIWRARNPANPNCTGPGQPFACCAGAGTGTCTEYVSGGTFTFHVGTGCTPVTLTASSPVTQKSWWRTTKNIARLTFSGAISAPLAGNVKIQQLLDAGAFGADLSGTFTFTVEPGNILKVRDNAATLQHRTWYAVRNTGDWACVAPFEVQYVVQMGDGNNDGRVLFTDLGFINSVIPRDPAADDDRHDINSDGRVLFTDMGVANAKIPSDIVPKPTGH